MKKIFLLSLVLTMFIKASAHQGVLDSSFGTNGIVNLGNTSGAAAFQVMVNC